MACNKYYGLKGTHRREVISYKVSTKQTVILSISCNHCKNPVCVLVCPENNFQKRSDGIVVHNASNCKGCERCINACPFHAPKLNPITNRADKCNFCVERIDEGLTPICIENCSTEALKMLRIKDDRNLTYENDDATPLKNYTKPSIFITKKQAAQLFFRE